jgi:hypothetical protein
MRRLRHRHRRAHDPAGFYLPRPERKLARKASIRRGDAFPMTWEAWSRVFFTGLLPLWGE